MTNFVIIADLHCCDISPKSRTDNYLETILTKVDWAIEYAMHYKAYVIVAGDLCHRKRPRDISHYIVNRLIDIFGKIGSKGVFAILGNHDVYSIKDDPQQAPVTTLQKAGVLTMLDGVPLNINDEVSLNGLNWRDSAEVNPELLKLSHRQGLVSIGVYHQYVIPDGIPFAGDHIKLSKAHPYLQDISIFGHFHDGFPGGAIRYGSKICINPGAIARERATKPNLTRPIQLGFLSIDGGKAGYCNVTIPHEPADKIFDLSKRKETTVSKKRVEQFVTQFSASVQAVTDVDLSSIEELTTLVKNLKLKPQIETETIKLLTDAYKEIET